MRVCRSLSEAADLGPSAVAIGTFDGMHLGHQALVQSMLQSARLHGLRSVVLTFDRHPMETLDPSRAPTLLTSQAQKERLIAGMGVEAMVVLPFDAALRDLSPEAFVRAVVVETLKARTVHVGEGFAFGRGRSGTLETLVQLGASCGFSVDVQRLITVAGVPVSSSRVRDALLSGAIEEVTAMLGRPYAVEGVVVGGDALGRKLGFPTVNLETTPRQCLPCDGVYATIVSGEELLRPGACSIGTRPTVGGEHRVLEIHVLDFQGDLYGRNLEAAFVKRLRDQVRFETLDALVRQMEADVEATRSVTTDFCSSGPAGGHVGP